MSKNCALCKSSADLRNSHIIPEFFFRLIYDHQPRRFKVISTDPAAAERYEQKGLRERLLCGNCEQKLSRWERYAKKVLIDGSGVQIIRSTDEVTLTGIDYATFRLFLLSLIWRMSVSKLAFFKDVNLGADEERLRQSLLSGDPLAPDDYCCLFIALLWSGQFIKDWIFEPTLASSGNQVLHWLVVNGVLLVVNSGIGPMPIELSNAALTKEGQMKILATEIERIPMLADQLARLASAQAARRSSGSTGRD